MVCGCKDVPIKRALLHFEVAAISGMAQFKSGSRAPPHIALDPKEQGVDKVLQPGLEHRPFSDDEIKQAFDTFDLDHNRFVGATEIKHILDTIGEEATDEEIDEMIRMCDTDGDGQVTYDEFYKMMTQPPPPPVVQLPKQKQKARKAKAKMFHRSATQQALEEAAKQAAKSSSSKNAVAAASARNFRATSVEALVRRLSGGMDAIKPSQIKKVYKRFRDIDIDGSGSIDFTEFVQALEMEDPVIAKQMFRVFDMDGSGSIEVKEFIVMLSRYTSAAKTEKLKFAFMMFDEDGSGMIDRSELLSMLQASFVVEGYSQEELEDKADAVFDFLGLPRDGSISYDNFLKLSTAKKGLIYPLQEETRTDHQNVAMNKAFETPA